MTGWIALGLTTIGVFLTAKKNNLCWFLLIAANFFWMHNLWNNTSAVIMQLVLLPFNVYGLWKWTRNDK